MTKLADDDYEAAVQRLVAFKEQQDRSEMLADEGSLAAARDLAAVLDDRRWADDLPPVKISHRRGRPVDPYGKSRLARWAKEHIGFTPRRAYQLLAADTIADELWERVQTIPSSVSEYSLRPLGRLLKQGRLSEARIVWDNAARFAGGAPSREQVQAALREYDPPRRGKADSKGTQQGIEFQILNEFRQLITAGKYRTAGELINEMGAELKKAIKDAA